MICNNFREAEGVCKYHEALIGTNEDHPSGCDEDDGSCIVDSPDFGGDWFMVDEEDCDMLDLVEEDEDGG
jgi:hypothetical protein